MLGTIRRNVALTIPRSHGAAVRRQGLMEKPIMVDRKYLVPVARRHALRRGIVLSSVAGLAVAAVIAAPLVPKTSIPTLVNNAAAAETAHAPDSFADLVARVKPAVISIRVKMANDDSAALGQGDKFEFPHGTPFDRFFRQFDFPKMPGGPQAITGEGSGFFISADGYAVTNYHVVDHAKSVEVTTDGGKSYKAKVVGTDPKTDIALIKVDGGNDFSYVKFADKPPRIGDWVIAVGNPYGLSETVTAGIVSARGRDIGASPYDDFLQVDAPMNKGNSGGPTFDVAGDVVGVNTAIFSPSGGSIGIGFAIPAETVKTVVAQLKDKGSVTRGWLGVQIQPVTPDIADGLGLKAAKGALVAQPKADSPAAKGGIKAGDVITAVDGQPVEDAHEFAMKIGAMRPGSSVKVDIWRNGKNQTLTLMLGELPNNREANADIEDHQTSGNSLAHLGLGVVPANEVGGAGEEGVVVTDVDPDGTAADHGLEVGDVILDVGGKAVSNAGDIRSAVREAQTAGKHDVLMRLKSGDQARFVALPIASA
jgi:serine protease Do